MLMYHTDSKFVGILRRTDCYLLAIYKNMSFIRIINSVDHIHESCLAASVFTQDRKNL